MMVMRYLMATAALLACFLVARSDEGDRLKPSERVFLAATVLTVKGPGEKMTAKALFGKAGKLCGVSIDRWEFNRDDPVLSSVQSIDAEPKLRAKFRESLKTRLGNDKERNSLVILRQIQRDYNERLVEQYRAVLKKTEGKGLEPGALPWPLCIPFDCCK